MWKWFLSLYDLYDCDDPPGSKRKCKVNLKKAHVEVTCADGKKHHFSLTGTCKYRDDCLWIYKDTNGKISYERFVRDAVQQFAWWQNRTGETGMACVGGDTYVSMCDVKNIAVKYSDYYIEFEVPQ